MNKSKTLKLRIGGKLCKQLNILLHQFVPEHYDLFLDLSRETKTFSGKVTITGQAKSDHISLHQKDLEIASVEVAGQARPFTVDHENEALHIELAEAGQVEVVIAFSGKNHRQHDRDLPFLLHSRWYQEGSLVYAV